LEAVWAGFTDPSAILHLLGTEKGAQLLDGNKVLLLSSDENNNQVDSTVTLSTKTSSFEEQMKAFAKAVRGEAPCIAPGEHGLAVTRMLAALYESAQKGAEVRLD